MVVGGIHAGYVEGSIRATALETVRTYARSLRSLANLSPTARYFMHSNVLYSRQSLDAKSRRALDAALERAEKRTSDRAVRRTTEVTADGTRLFVERPPTMTHLEFGLEEMLDLYGATGPP